ncbi:MULTISPECIES: ABC-F family ATP-binding cassette domain-containing protein [Kytococcus]|uniref:ABC transporter ATP-binding protein n=1 Tax=Kytococcus schroeteri TaxID=138300 RepID=A0A2I1PDW3_9MICO|nr:MULTISPECIES: ATP-binding cassette domain-containing protein [Kytococcus]OFS13105.1 ABC transporter ATP-binding protein [Kytococcus sp. HMSC28H12]PKZ42790.1 ABC transporter ATP-binding protein [Kytococcus schroeteri]
MNHPHPTDPTTSAGHTASDHLRLDGISRTFPDRRVLTDVSLTIPAGQVAVLIGENGSGKSTLLRLAAGLDEPDAGTVHRTGTVGLHHQEPPFDLHLTVEQVLQRATAPVRALIDEVERAGQEVAADVPGATERLADALARAEHADAWEIDHRTDRVVEGLGISRIHRSRRADELSGGQVSRLSLTWFLLRSPHTLLLDEPTNHLDDAAAGLLTDLLTAWKGPVLLASHDRTFTDQVADVLYDLDPSPLPYADVATDHDSPGSGHGVTRFTGRWGEYLTWQRRTRAEWETRFRDEQAEIRRLEQRERDDHTVGRPERGPRTEARVAKKFYADRNAKVVARRVNDARTALERLREEQVRKPPATLTFRALDGLSRASVPPGPVLTASGVAVTGRLAPTSVSLTATDRLLVTGPNGSGKSTLLAVLAGPLRPDAGSVTRAPRLTTGLLTQEPRLPDGDPTVREAYRLAVGDRVAQEVPLAATGLLAGRDLDRPVSRLSVGQRRRLDLAVALASPPEVLLLDEPTNHLSLRLATELEEALVDYPGAVVIATHDRWLRENWDGRVLDLTP